MRFLQSMLVAVAALCTPFSAHAQQAQQSQSALARGDDVNQAALESGNARTRDAEIARVIAAADQIFPFYYAPLVDALYRSGRGPEARQWNANALLRMMIDIDFMGAAGESTGGLADFLSFYRMALQRNPPLTAFLDSDPRAQKAAIEAAIVWEQTSPRRYLVTDRFTIDEARARAGGFAAALPERARNFFAEAQARQIAGARDAAVRRAATADLMDDADAAVREGRPAREAIEAVPEDMRGRLAARRSVKLACPGEIRFAAGAAASEGARQGAIVCGELERDSFQIVDLATGATLQRAPTLGLDPNAGAFSEGGAVTLVARRDYENLGDPRGLRSSRVAPLYTLSAAKRLAPMRLQIPAEVGAGHQVSAQPLLFSQSGRFAVFSFTRAIEGAPDPTQEVAAAYDLPARALLWRSVRPYVHLSEERPASEQIAGGFIDESGPYLVSMVREARAAPGGLKPIAIERVNLETGATSRFPLPEGIENAGPAPYGPGRALMYMRVASQAEEARREYLVIDLGGPDAAMRIAWRGLWADRPAEAAARLACTQVSYAEGEAQVELWTVTSPSLPQPIKLDPLRGRPWSSCAASADGRHVALIVPPYAHVFEITEP
ncbi:MAG: hypothetical protein JNJ73_03895 [Hyphomonadaceae bacterium]|nr:hypothetical protein [Hyphomonadaceae bacterium]